jgi:hypothetical protein
MADDAAILAVDAGRFTGEGSDLSLLHYLRQIDGALDTLAPDAILPHVAALHALFTRLLVPNPQTTTATALPKPGRPIRHLAARVLVKLHKRVESHSLFDLVQALLRGVDGGNKSMSALENVQRVASWYTVGEIIKEHGGNVSLRCARRWCWRPMRGMRRAPNGEMEEPADVADDVVHGRDLHPRAQGPPQQQLLRHP